MENVAQARSFGGTREPLSVGKSILYGWLTVGIVDWSDACLFWYFRAGATPVGIGQSVAGGLLGREAARAGGWPVGLLGFGIHLFVALCVVATCVWITRRVPVLARHPIVWGIVYGLGVYLVMYHVVMPLSQIGAPKYTSLVVTLNNLGIHMLGVGLPSALWARRAVR
jgi:hypothetical protein